MNFTGILKTDLEGKWYREQLPGEPQYVGSPNDDIDQAWDNLLEGKHLRCSQRRGIF